MACGQTVYLLDVPHHCPPPPPPESMHPVGGTDNQKFRITHAVSLLRCPRACSESMNKVATVTVAPTALAPSPHGGLCCMCSCQNPRMVLSLIAHITHDNLPPHTEPHVLHGALPHGRQQFFLTRTARLVNGSDFPVGSTIHQLIALLS